MVASNSTGVVFRDVRNAFLVSVFQKPSTQLLPPSIDISNAVWFKEQIPRCSFIMWLAINQRLPTKDRLISWGMQVPDACVLCDAATESHQHLFFHCPFVKAVWLRFCGRLLTAPPSEMSICQNQVSSFLWIELSGIGFSPFPLPRMPLFPFLACILVLLRRFLYFFNKYSPPPS